MRRERLERGGEPPDLEGLDDRRVELLGLREEHSEADTREALGEAHDTLVVGLGGVCAERDDEAGDLAVAGGEGEHPAAALGVVERVRRGVAGEPRDGAAGEPEHDVGGEGGRAQPVVGCGQRGEHQQQRDDAREEAQPVRDRPRVHASRGEPARVEAAHGGMVRRRPRDRGGNEVERAFGFRLYSGAAGLVGGP